MLPLWEKINRGIHASISKIILLLALAQGLLYLFLVPPWQHYDEPGNFEYAWLAANLNHWPDIGDYNVEMRREVAASMMEHNFYRDMASSPNLVATTPPPYIGLSQLGDVPLYYFLASLPLRIFKYTDITFQLYSARVVSLGLLLLTIWGTLGISHDLFGKGHPLSWMVPLFLALFPTLTDLMTAVNNDAAAIAFSVLFLWGSIRVIKRGFNAWNTIWIIATLVASILSKKTTIIVLPLFFLVIMIGVYKQIHKRLFLVIMSLLGIVLLLLFFSFRNSSPELFLAKNESLLPSRLRSDKTPVGKYVFGLPAQSGNDQVYYQMLPQNNLTQLLGKIVTLGVWMWADQPVDIQFPELIIDNIAISKRTTVHLDREPLFYAYSVQLPQAGSLGWIKVFAINSDEKITAYWDGWILAEGDFSGADTPVFLDDQASSGEWNGSHIDNIIRNASGEKPWPRFSLLVDKYLIRGINFSSSYLWSIMDFQGTGWYFRGTINWIYQTFWVRFGWSQVSLIGARFYWIFLLVSIIGVAGSLLAAWHNRKHLPLGLLLIFVIDFFGTLLITIYRGVGSWFTHLVVPVARYAFPAIIPAGFIVCGGLWFTFDRYNHQLRIPKIIGAVCFIACLALYDILAVLTFVRFYNL